MKNAIDQLNNMKFNTNSIAALVQQVRAKIEGARDGVKEAKKIIKQVTGVNVSIVDVTEAIPFTQYVVSIALKADDSMQYTTIIEEARKNVSTLFKTHSWLSAEKAKKNETVAAVVDVLDTKVVVKEDGKMKKGGKRVLAVELFNKYVANAAEPLTNPEFVKLLMDKLGMTKYGATTYAYNCRKAIFC